MALGVTMQLPVDDKHNYSRDYLKDQIAILLGGRIAEEITNGELTTGAGNDLERVTELARKMVCEWGMSDAMGPLTFGKREEQIFLGREISKTQDYSEETARPDRPGSEALRHGQLRARAQVVLDGAQAGAAEDRRRAARARSARRRSGHAPRAGPAARRAGARRPPPPPHRRRRAASRPSGRRSCRRWASRSGRNKRSNRFEVRTSKSDELTWPRLTGLAAFDFSASSSSSSCPLSIASLASRFRFPTAARSSSARARSSWASSTSRRIRSPTAACGSIPTSRLRDALQMVADGRRHPRHRRRVDAAGRAAAAGRRRTAARAAGARGPARPRRRADFDRHLQGRGRRARDRPGRDHRQRHQRADVRSGAGRRRRAPAGRRRPDAQPRAIGGHVRAGAATRTWPAEVAASSATRARARGRRHRARPDHPRSRPRLREARGALVRRAGRPADARGARLSDPVRAVAQVVPQGRARRRAAAPNASGARPPPSPPRSCSGAHIVRVHDVAEMVEVVRTVDQIRPKTNRSDP